MNPEKEKVEWIIKNKESSKNDGVPMMIDDVGGEFIVDPQAKGKKKKREKPIQYLLGTAPIDSGGDHVSVGELFDSMMSPDYTKGFVPVGPETLHIGAPNWDGFKFDPNVVTHFRFSQQMKHGKRLVSTKSSMTKPQEAPNAPTIRVWTYRGQHSTEPNYDDGIRYVYTGENPKLGYFLPKCYIKLDDLRHRLYTKQRFLLRDYEALKQKQCPFPAWNPQGQKLGIGAFGDVDQLKNVVPGLKTSGKDLTDLECANVVFWVISGTAEGAQRRPKLMYNVMARFWDADIKDAPTCEVYIHQNYRALIRNKNKVAFGHESFFVEAQIRQMVVEAKLKFQPQVKVKFYDKWEELNLGKDRPNAWFGYHPNDLFILVMSKSACRKLIKDAKGKLFKEPLELKDNANEQFAEEIKKIKTIYQKVHKEDPKTKVVTEKTSVQKEGAHGTLTGVTGNSVAGQGSDRGQTQNKVMGNTSATEILHALFKTSEEDKGEWLHRSAWSFGGLDNLEGKSNPNFMVDKEANEQKNRHIGNFVGGSDSVQNIRNLVLGTAETNTQMLRTEMFIKRYVYNAIAPNNTEVKMSLRTHLFSATTVGAKNARGALWFGHFLQYQYACYTPLVYPPCFKSVRFKPFDRHTPMRLEAELDILLEELIYGWKELAMEEDEEEVK